MRKCLGVMNIFIIFNGMFHTYPHVKTYKFFVLNMFNSLYVNKVVLKKSYFCFCGNFEAEVELKI